MFNLFLGIILFIGLIVFAILSGGSIETFIDMPSLIIVVVGALIFTEIVYLVPITIYALLQYCFLLFYLGNMRLKSKSNND